MNMMKNCIRCSPSYLVAVVCALQIGARPAGANVIGSDFQIFNPTPSGVDFLTVHSSETLEKRRFHLSLYTNFAANSLPYFEAENGNDFRRERAGYFDLIGGYDFSVAYGLTESLELALTLPGVLIQDGGDRVITGRFGQTGFTEIRPMVKYRITKEDAKQGIALVASMNNNLIENNVFLGRNPSPTFNFEVAADSRFGQNNFAINLGRRWRSNEGSLLDRVPPLVDAWLWSAAFSRYFPKATTKLFLEYYASLPAESVEGVSSNRLSYSEFIAGARYDLSDRSSVVAGGGTEVLRGTSTPTWRLFAGVTYTFGPDAEEPKLMPLPVVDEAPELTVLEENFGYEPQPEFQVAEVGQPTPDEFASGSDSGTDGGAVSMPPVADLEYNAPSERFVLQNVNFKLDSDNFVYGQSKAYLQEMGQKVKELKNFEHLVIVGHTDNLGSDRYNMGLSKRRAESIKKFFVTRHKIPASRIKTIGKGERYPIADNGNAQGRLKNRRVEFLLYTADNPYDPVQKL